VNNPRTWSGSFRTFYSDRPGLTAPEDIAGSPLPHVKYLLLREIRDMKSVVLAKKIKTGVRARLAKIKQRAD
jgi:hypothetical protein